MTRALELVLYLLPHAKSGREHYIREKLNTRNPSLCEAVREAMTEKVSPGARYAVLEYDLRVVVALLRDAQTLNPGPASTRRRASWAALGLLQAT